MAAKEALAKVKPAVFAEHDPAIIAVFPHTDLPGAVALIGRENQWRAVVGLSGYEFRAAGFAQTTGISEPGLPLRPKA